MRDASLPPVPPDPERFHGALERALVDDLESRALPAQLGLLVTLVFVALVLGDALAQPSVRGIGIALVAVVVVRLVFALAARRRRGAPTDPLAAPGHGSAAKTRRRHLRFVVMTGAFGCGMGALTSVAYPYLPPDRVALLFMCLAGMTSGAVLSMGASPRAYLAYILPTLLPLGVTAALGGRGLAGQLLPLMVALYTATLFMLARHEHAFLRANLLLRFELRDLALRDSLTQLRNRRFVAEIMRAEGTQALRAHEARDPAAGPATSVLSLMMLDLDWFKSINDAHGHEAGDAVLRQAADRLRETLRKPDVVARWGGEEFVVITRETSADAVAKLATRLQRRVGEHPFRLASGEPVRLTCSIGYAAFPFLPAAPTRVGWEQALALADLGLYRAKQAGRNRVVAVLPGPTPWPDRADAFEAVCDDPDDAVANGWIVLAASSPDGQPTAPPQRRSAPPGP